MRRDTQRDVLRAQVTAAILDHAVEGIMLTDRTGVIWAVNPAFTASTGYSEEEVVGKRPNVLSSGIHDAQFYAKLWESIHETGAWRGEIWNRRKNGELYLERLTITCVRDEKGRIVGYAGIFTDLTEQLAAEERMRRQRECDDLTGLPNRLAFQQRLQQLLEEEPPRFLAVVFLDLFRFQRINDSMGYAVGDRVLKTVAERIAAAVSRGDTVARLGGDEFGLLLTGLSGQSEAEEYVRRILKAVEQPVTVDGQEVFCTGSAGVSRFPEDGTDAEALMKKADAALYRARESGGNAFHVYTAETDGQAALHVLLQNDLHRALQREEFELYYQPKVDVATGKLAGMEALLRWNHPKYGLLSPGSFVPLAEQSGFIVPMGEWVLQTACRQNALWQKAGYRPLRVAVNLSASQIRKGNIAETVARILDETRLRPADLELEITESVAMNADERVFASLFELKRLGVTLTVDDFGTGYSTFNYLTRYPIDCLKIDRTFVQHLATDADSAAIVESILAMARRLHLRVVAEGVETREHVKLLKRWRCDYAQGYYYGKPVPAGEFETWLAAGAEA